ncbi:PPR1A phosphatase, partial [Eudromia elegans]|nr:PPR1A phosphatase [Eudromia elegans]
MSPRQRKKVSRTTPTMKELQMMVEHHLCKQARGEEEEDEDESGQEQRGPGCCHHEDGDTEHSHSPGGTCPLAQPSREATGESRPRDGREQLQVSPCPLGSTLGAEGDTAQPGGPQAGQGD